VANDTELFSAWMAGQADAGRTLISRHYPRILSFFCSKVPAEAARDLTQSTFETLCANAKSFRGESSFVTYLFGIARWKLVDHLRREGKQRERFDPLRDSVEDLRVERSLGSLLQDRRDEMTLVLALRKLPLDDQIILELRDYEGLTGRELAEIYGVKRTTMTARLSSARRRLAALVSEVSAGGPSIEETASNLDRCMRRIHAAFLQSCQSGMPLASGNSA
jgi:RNA polymerase sigma-70 factor (ECF subfamily)